MDLSFDQIEYFLLLLTLPLFYIANKSYKYWKNSARKKFADEKFVNVLFSKKNSNRRFYWYLFYIILITLALVDVIDGSQKIKVKNKTVEIVLAIDISNSMNAMDITPSRLENAKKIADEIIKKIPRNKIGLLVFAGQAYTLIPLTNDSNALTLFIHSINSKIIDYQGTNLGNAIKESCGLFNSNQKSEKIIILISDGENHISNEDSGIRIAKQSNIKIISIGIGTQKGATIPYYSAGQQGIYFTDKKGDAVITKLHEKNMQKIAEKTHGKYIKHHSQSGTLQFIRESLKAINNNSIKKNENELSKHYFQWFLTFALLVFFIISLTNIHNEFNI